jgi:uncharacterized membrane protein
VKDTVYNPPLPQVVCELQDRITAAVQTIDESMLQNVSQELDYRIHVCRETKGAHIEHL